MGIPQPIRRLTEPVSLSERGEAHEPHDIRPNRPLRTSSMNLAMLWTGPGTSRRPIDLATTLALVVGGGLVIWSSYIHFHLWDSVGYRHIATIGPLFLLQSIAGFLLGLMVLAVRRAWVAVLGVGFSISTLAGFLISVDHGLFGFKDSWEAPFAKQAFGIDLSIIVVLALAGALCLAGSASSQTTRATPAGITS
jgi:hypothetical protein